MGAIAGVEPIIGGIMLGPLPAAGSPTKSTQTAWSSVAATSNDSAPAQVSVDGIGSVHKNGRGSGGVQAGYDLLCNDGTFTYTGDDHPPLAGQNSMYHLSDVFIQVISQAGRGFRFLPNSAGCDQSYLFRCFQGLQ